LRFKKKLILTFLDSLFASFCAWPVLSPLQRIAQAKPYETSVPDKDEKKWVSWKLIQI
jgi:hypothetical protein